MMYILAIMGGTVLGYFIAALMFIASQDDDPNSKNF